MNTHIPPYLLEQYSDRPEQIPIAIRNDILDHLEKCESCEEFVRMLQTAAAIAEEEFESEDCLAATRSVLAGRRTCDSGTTSVVLLVPDIQSKTITSPPPSAVALAAQSSVNHAHFVLMNSLTSSDFGIRMNILRRVATGELLAQVLSEDGRYVEHVIVTFPAHEATCITNAIGEFLLPRSASLIAIDHGAMVHWPVVRAPLADLGLPVPIDLLDAETRVRIDDRVCIASVDRKVQEPLLRIRPIPDPGKERISYLAVLHDDHAILAGVEENGFTIALSDLREDAALLFYE